MLDVLGTVHERGPKVDQSNKLRTESNTAQKNVYVGPDDSVGFGFGPLKSTLYQDVSQLKVEDDHCRQKFPFWVISFRIQTLQNI